MRSKFCWGLTCLVFVAFHIDYVSSLSCYVCSTKNSEEKDCLEIPEGSTKYLQNCTAPKNLTCRIQQQWIDFEISDDGRDRHIIRQCASTEYDPYNPCYYRTGYLGRMNVCSCTEDACNEGTRCAPTIFSIIFLVFLLSYLL
ncbi:uncharacterized protein LOC129969842 [Argiope bruennichi]|uniref:uncharacterized protein LOC129969842 n=1 Tax=Argiope bruennichi TaxID=94029 RepID=UPI0024941A19|nr:uncharacterized protein LOC129969842 [Argiope bruennichi]